MPISITYDRTTKHLTVDGTDQGEAITRNTHPSILQIGMLTSEMSGFDGGDRLHGGFGRDLIHGDDGDDSLDGEENSDDVRGGAGNDLVTTRYTGLAESIAGNSGDDILQFFVALDPLLAPAVATISGGSDTDLLRVGGSGAQSSLLIDLRAGQISDIRTSAQYAQVSGIEDVHATSSDHLDIRGNGKDNQLIASLASDRIAGGGGDDTLVGDRGGDTLRGNAGRDFLYDYTLDAYTSPAGYAARDTLYGGANNDWLTSIDGDDTLIGGSGADVLVSIAGDDVLLGGADDDHIVFRLPDENYPDDFPLGFETDMPHFEFANPRTPRDFAGLTINGGGGSDWVWFDALASLNGVSRGAVYANLERGVARIHVQAANEPKFDLKNIENLVGTDQNDRVSGTGVRNSIHGQDGNDLILGLGGADALFGNGGMDTVIGGDGNDFIRGHGDADRLKGGSGDDQIDGGGGDDRVWGDADHDTLFGGQGDDRLFGGTEMDLLVGEGGNDRLDGGKGNDRRLQGDGGHDVLFGRDGRDNLYGGPGIDTLFGGAGQDNLEGGRGSDTLAGGAGRDNLDGGLGPDVFVMRPGSAIDSIYNGQFGNTSTQDVVDLRGFGLTRFDQLELQEVPPGDTNPKIESYSLGGVLILMPTLGDGVFLVGASLRDMDANDFMF